MAKKYDTNRLEPDFPEKARQSAEKDVSGYQAPASPYATGEFPQRPASVTEDETLLLEETRFNSYSRPRGDVDLLQATMPPQLDRASSRKEAKTGLPEKWLIGLPYVPFSIGLVAGLILLVVIPKEESKVRFHAAQGLAAHVGILLVGAILGGVSKLTPVGEIPAFIFSIVTTVMLIIFAIKAWSGKPVHIESVDDLTNWLEEKIGPYRS